MFLKELSKSSFLPYNYKIQPKRLHNSSILTHTPAKKKAIQHLSSSPRTPGTAAHDPPASQTLESAGQLSERSKNVCKELM